MIPDEERITEWGDGSRDSERRLFWRVVLNGHDAYDWRRLCGLYWDMVKEDHGH